MRCVLSTVSAGLYCCHFFGFGRVLLEFHYDASIMNDVRVLWISPTCVVPCLLKLSLLCCYFCNCFYCCNSSLRPNLVYRIQKSRKITVLGRYPEVYLSLPFVRSTNCAHCRHDSNVFVLKFR